MRSATWAALYSEGSPPIEVADRLALSMPQIVQENGLGQRAMKAINDDYKWAVFYAVELQAYRDFASGMSWTNFEALDLD